MNRDHAGFHGDLAVGADAAEMMGAAQRQKRDTGFAATRRRPLHRLPSDPATEAALAVESQDGAVVLDESRRGSRLEQAAAEMVGVGRHESDAVAVVAHEVRGDERLRDERRLAGRTAHAPENGGGQPGERVVPDQHQNRPARNGAGSTAGVRPAARSAISLPVAAASVRPRWPWPKAR